ncbi:protein shisa-4-like [Mugil cephalus]|uniref:protein shisa-4-like n=1 Tax=Mugil cephalus TaxID=48193 RepID=UPI001FB7878B|nr:protein shisa-4-like [Mugil cephalus]
MVSTVLSRLVCFLCVIVIPVAFADDCSSYYDSYGVFHDAQSCVFCCGNCHNKYCCYSWSERFTKAAQKRCQPYTGEATARGSRRYSRINPLYIIIGVTAAILCIFLAGLVICCCVPCCWCYKRRQNARNRRHTNVANTITLFHSQQQVYSLHGYQQPHSGYQSVPVYMGSTMPATAPPSYLQCTSPAYSPAAFGQGQPMHPFQPPSQPYAPPPLSDESAPPPPYNPSYVESS